MTLAITPTNSSNKLVIEVRVNAATGTARNIFGAIFQDSTASALHCFGHYQSTATGHINIMTTFYMAAGTTSATTFKVRAGPHAAATVTFNGHGGARKFGGAYHSSITITEIQV